MDIYHGSKDIIKKPIYGYEKPYNDYGLGFYCTKDIELAKEWSVSETLDGYVNKYKLNDKNLNILNLNNGEYSILHWLTLLLNNRQFNLRFDIQRQGKKYLDDNFRIDISKYDVIIGYRADDSYFRFASDFLENSITIDKLYKAMYLGKLGEQIVLKSERAFKQIKFVDSEKVSNVIYYPKKNSRDLKARKDYYKLEDNVDSLYIMDLIRNKVKANDKRLYL